jgi:hypothetical protein
MLRVGQCVISTTHAAGEVIDQWSLSLFILFFLSVAGSYYCDSSEFLRVANNLNVHKNGSNDKYNSGSAISVRNILFFGVVYKRLYI